MIEIDGAQHSGSGTIVRQAVMYAALTGQAVHITNAREKRLKPGLQPQHVKVVEAIGEMVGGSLEGVSKGSQDIVFRPGERTSTREYLWDIGSAGSTTMLALALLPVLLLSPTPVTVELRGGLFQDFAPSLFHLEHVILPLLEKMGGTAAIEMGRPGYVPVGGGILRLAVEPVVGTLRPLTQDQPATVQRVWGIALASRLEQRNVAGRMAEAATAVLGDAGYNVGFTLHNDTTALQSGAALAAFADLSNGSRLGADRAGAPRRPSEAIGREVARQLLADLQTGATLDRYAADQIIPFAALAQGESRFRIAEVTDHIASNAWLAHLFLGAEVHTNVHELVIRGVGFRPGGR